MKEEILTLLDDTKKVEFENYISKMVDVTSISKEGASDFINKFPNLVSELDRRVSGGVNKYKDETFDIAIEKKVAEIKVELESTYNPVMTDEQKRIAELEKKLIDSDKKDVKNSQLIVAKAILKESDVDLSFFDVSNLTGTSDEETRLNVEKAVNPYIEFHKKNVESLGTIIQSEVDVILKKGHKPVEGKQNSDDTNLNAVLESEKPMTLREQSLAMKQIRENKNKE
jgi:hypothetical protein